MTLILTIENEQSLPNGAPLSVRLADKRGLDIGRGANLDWSLPDPTRFISGKHCEVRYRDDAYWLNDLSTNGTFLNDSARRIQAPHRLRHGDRLTIGSYIIAVAIEADEEEGEGAPAPLQEAAPEEPQPQAEPAERPSAEIIHIASIAGSRADRDASEDLKAEAAALLGAEAERAASYVSDFLSQDFISQDFIAPSGLESGEPTPLASPAILASPQASLAIESLPLEQDPPAAEVAIEAAAKIALVIPPEKAPSDDSLAAQALEAQAWNPPERGASTPGGQGGSPPAANPEPADCGTSERTAPSLDEFLRHFAKGAGVPEHIFARQDGLKVAEELGGLVRMAVENLTQLLNARFKAKRFARTSSQTMIQAFDNNPLKFAPTSDDALKIMFGPRTSGYLEAKRAFDGAFTDLKTHQVNTFAAMQQAVRMLVEDLDPKAIDEAAGADKGLAALFGGRKGRLWDLYLARWQAKTLRHEDGLVDAFMLYFAECYDQAKDSKSN